jgi:GNAT superfamily N-acetyltransferase
VAAATGPTRVERAGIERLDDVRDLWLELHGHHRVVVGALPLVEDDELSWRRRRALYAERLESDSAFLALAIDEEAAAVVGYAFVCLEEGPGDTFPLADRYAELYSLSVTRRLRGGGIGTQLLEFVDRELARRSIHDLKVAVMAANADALRLYERRGLRPAELVLYRFGLRPPPSPSAGPAGAPGS